MSHYGRICAPNSDLAEYTYVAFGWQTFHVKVPVAC